MNTLQENPFSIMSPQNPPLISSSQPRKWFLVFGFILLLILILSITSYIFFVYLPEKAIQEYVNKAGPIVSKLNEEVSSFKQNNFLSAKNIKTDIAAAQLALEKHRADLNNTKNKIALLRTEYTKLKPTGETKMLNQLTEQFNLIESILDEYDKDLNFRKQVFDAFGEQFPQQLENFDTLFYGGKESRTDFILLTAKVSNLAQQTLYALSNLFVPEDETEEYNYRKDYVEDIKNGFDKLNEYYRTNNNQNVGKSVEELSQKITDSNYRYESIVESYVNNSSIALGLKQFELQSQIVKETVKTVQDFFREEPQGKLVFYTKNKDLKILDIATKKIALIGNGYLNSGSGTGRGGAGISPNGNLIYYAFSPNKFYPYESPETKHFIYDIRTGKNYLIHTENGIPLAATWSKDSKALLFYSLGKDVNLKILKVSSKKDLENLVLKNVQLSPELVNLDYTSTGTGLSLINENEILFAADKKDSRDMLNKQIQEVIKEATAAGRKIERIDDLSSFIDLNKTTISRELIKFNAFTGRVVQHLTIHIPFPIYLGRGHTGCWNFFSLTPDNKLICLWEEHQVGQEEGTSSPERIKIVLVDPSDFSVKKESEISEVAFDRSMRMPIIRLLKDKVLIETEKIIFGSEDEYGNRKAISDSQKIFFRNIPDLTKDERGEVVELQTINPSFDKYRTVNIEAISPRGRYMILTTSENCQQPQGCESKYYLYNFRDKKADLIHVEYPTFVQNHVREAVLTND